MKLEDIIYICNIWTTKTLSCDFLSLAQAMDGKRKKKFLIAPALYFFYRKNMKYKDIINIHIQGICSISDSLVPP